MKKKIVVYMGDLTHDTLLISNEIFPLGIGYVTAYAQTKIPDHFEFRLFKFPNEILDAINNSPPEILALSCFPWNKNLDILVAAQYKNINKDGIVILGGNTIPHRKAGQEVFLTKHSIIDLLVMYDGELGFSAFLSRYLQVNGNRKKLFDGKKINGCVYLKNEEKNLIIGDFIKRPKVLDDIPSPYLTGLMDPFFDNDMLSPIIQSTRGCPFTCAYCWAGNSYNSQTRHFSIDRVLSEIEYIADKRRDKMNRLLVLADSNFGMYAKDQIIADKIGSLQELYNFPSSFATTLGKNNKENIFKIITKIRNCSINVSVQSTDEQIQRNVKRQPIDLDQYQNIVQKIKGMGLRVLTEIITGLPGETRKTHLKTIEDLINMGFDDIGAFTFMFLEGAELNEPESQKKNKWHKCYRLIPRNFGIYNGKLCLEIETVGVGSATFDFDDYIYLRGLQGVLAMVFNNNIFSEYIKYLTLRGVDIFSFLKSLYEDVKTSRGTIGVQVREYLAEAKEELWDSEDDLIGFFQETINYQKLLDGSIGDNLQQKYKSITVLQNLKEWCVYLYDRSLRYLEIENRLDEQITIEMTDIKNHTIAKGDNVISPQNAEGNVYEIFLFHNVQKWKDDNYSKPLSYYRYPEKTRVEYFLRDHDRRLVKEILSLYSSNKSYLWKVMMSRYSLPAVFRAPNNTNQNINS